MPIDLRDLIAVAAFLLSVYNLLRDLYRNRIKIEIYDERAVFHRFSNGNHLLLRLELANPTGRALTVRTIHLCGRDNVAAKTDALFTWVEDMPYADGVQSHVANKLLVPATIPPYGCVSGVVLIVGCPSAWEAEVEFEYNVVCVGKVFTRKANARESDGIDLSYFT